MNQNNGQGNEKWRMNGRLAIYAMAGFYLLTLAYQMIKVIPRSTGGMKMVMIVASIAFIAIGIAMMSYGLIYTWRNAKEIQKAWEEEAKQELEESSEEEEE